MPVGRHPYVSQTQGKGNARALLALKLTSSCKSGHLDSSLRAFTVQLFSMDVLKTTTLFLQTTATLSAMHTRILPRDEPTITSDPWQCATEDIPQYFEVPKPTGSLLTALISYGDKLYEGCTPTEEPTGIFPPKCPFPEQSSWCAFTTAAPTAVLSDYSSYASSASFWWAEHSAAAVSVAQKCPNTWFKIISETPNGDIWLNNTIAFAGCYAEEHPAPTNGFSTVTISSGSTATAT